MELEDLEYWAKKDYRDGTIIATRDPTVYDWNNYPRDLEWINQTSGKIFIFKEIHAIWEPKDAMNE